MKPTDVVETAVVALADQRVDSAGFDPDVLVLLQHIFHQRGGGGADAQSVGHDDRCLDGAQLLHLHQTHGLAEAVDNGRGRHDLVLEKISLVGEDGCDAGVHIGSVTDGDMTHLDAGDVGDQVALAGSAPADLQTGFFVQTHSIFLAIL